MSTEKLRRATEIDADAEDYIDGETVAPAGASVLPEVTATQKAAASVKRRLAIQDSTAVEVVDPEVAEREAAIEKELAEKKAKEAKQ